MLNETEIKIKRDLFAEILELEQNYIVIKSFVAGKDYEVTVIGLSIQAFKDSLSRASAFVLGLYNLKGKRVNIPLESLFTSLDYGISDIFGVDSAKSESRRQNNFVYGGRTG